jgi:hypothetical protein
VARRVHGVVLALIFVIDFTYRPKTAPLRWRYMRHGGVFDLLACSPGLRIFRLFRIYRAVNVIRRVGGPRVLCELREELASGTLYLVVFLGITTLKVIASATASALAHLERLLAEQQAVTATLRARLAEHERVT